MSWHSCWVFCVLSFQWGEMPTSVAYIGTGQIMGWGNKAIEVSQEATKKCLRIFVFAELNCFSISFFFFCAYRFDQWKVDTWTVFLCTRKLNVSSSFAKGTTKCSLAVPKVLRRVKFTLWHWTNREWLTGRNLLYYYYFFLKY